VTDLDLAIEEPREQSSEILGKIGTKTYMVIEVFLSEEQKFQLHV
jgi:hypothetical protein